MLDRLKTSLAVAYRLRAKPRVITIDGIKVSADRDFVTKDIAKALYRVIRHSFALNTRCRACASPPPRSKSPSTSTTASIHRA